MSLRRSSSPDHGFTLVEVLIALSLLTTMALALAGLLATAVQSTYTARDRTTTTMLAMQRMEELRALTWGFADTEQLVPASDVTTDLSRTPATPAGPGLAASPAGALEANIQGHVDFLDRLGRWVGTGEHPPPSAVYVRRWRVTPLASAPDRTLVLQVRVTTIRGESATNVVRPRPGRGDGALFETLRTRKAS